MKPGIFSILILILTGLILGLLISGLPTIATLCILSGIAVFYLALFYPLLIMTVLLCAVPFNILWMGIGVTLLETIYSYIYVLLGISWILKRICVENSAENLSSPITVPLTTFFCASILACIIGISRGHQFEHWGSDLNAIMFYGLCFIMLDIVKDKKQLYRIFLLIVISTTVALLIARDLEKIKSASVFALIMFIISVAMIDTLRKRRTKILFIGLSFFFVIMQLISFARSVWLAAIFGLAFLFFVSLERQRKNFLKLGLGAVLLLALYISVAMSVPTDNLIYKSIYAIEKRYESIFTAKEEPSIITRGSEWTEAKRKALEHPFFGNGLGTQFTYFRYDQWFGAPAWITTRYIHNVYLFLFLNMGIIGLLSFLWFCVSFIRYGLSIYRSLENGMDKALTLGILSSFASLMVVSFAGPFLTSPMMTMWLGFFTGALIIIDRNRKTTDHRPQTKYEHSVYLPQVSISGRSRR